MECTQCGAEVPAGARYCPACAHPTTGPVDERRVVTVLFADIVGFTTLSETLDPERVKRLLDAWFERLVADIADFGGRVDKIIGDGILALFGAPVAHEDDAERAVRAALRMQETLATMSGRATDTRPDRSPKVQMRIGVNTGEVLVGALRAGGATTAMGDVVNTASRLQTAARPGEVLVGPTTHIQTAHAIAYERRGLLAARGREAPVDAWAASCALLPPGQRPARIQAPLVGRSRELGLIEAAVAASLGHSRALLGVVVGDTGVGKTRLLSEAAGRLAAGRDVVVLEGRCVPYGEANVWWPLAEALHGEVELDPGADLDAVHDAVWVRVAASLGDATPECELDRVTDGLMTLMGHDISPGRDPSRAREAAIEAFVAFVEGHARRRPVILALSDVHWADAEVLGLIKTLLERLARCPLIVLATARQAVREHWSPPPGRHDTLVVNLDPLDDAAAGELLDALGGHVPADLRDDLLARGGGNPFFIEELVALVESGGPGARPGLPDTLRGIVTARLDALDVDERAVLTDAAVIGRRGWTVGLREMAFGMGRRLDIDQVMATLAANELLEVDGENWEFRSEIAREVAYATLPKAERAHRHSGIAAWLEAHSISEADGEVDLDGPRAEEALAGLAAISDGAIDRVAYHWAVAAELVGEMGELTMVPEHAADRAVVWLSASARRAQRRDLLPAAERAYTRALELAGPTPVSRRVRLLASRSRVRADQWDLTGARDDAEGALAGAASTGDRSVEAAAVMRLGDIDQRAGDTPAALARLRHAADRYALEGDERGRGEALRLLGMTQMFAGEMADATASVLEARDAFAAAGTDAGQGWAAQSLAWIALLQGDLDTTEVEVERAVALFTEAEEEVGTAWANGLLAFVRFTQGRRDEAEALATHILDDATGSGDRWATAMMRGLLGSIKLWDGRVAEALRETGAAVQAFRDLGDPWGLSITLANHGRALAMSGRVEDGFDAAREAAGLTAGPGRSEGIGAMAVLALAIQVGEPDRARDVFEFLDLPRAVGTLTVPESDSTVALARLQRGEVPPMPDAVGRALGFATGALVAAASGDVEGALAAARAVPGCGEATFLDRTMADVAAGLALVRSGSPEDALTCLDRAAAEVGATEDLVGQAVVALARAVATEGAGRDSAVSDRSDAVIALARLGLTATGWETAFALAAGVRPAVPASG